MVISGSPHYAASLAPLLSARNRRLQVLMDLGSKLGLALNDELA
jgi:hypothetical protein